MGLLVWYARTSKETRQEYRDALTAAKAEFELRLKEEHTRLLDSETHAQTQVEELRRRLAEADTVVAAERAARREADLVAEGLIIRLEHAQTRLRIAKGEDIS